MQLSKDWSQLEKIATPEKWLAMYSDYQDLLTKADVAAFWNEQFNIQCKLTKNEALRSRQLEEALRKFKRYYRFEELEGEMPPSATEIAELWHSIDNLLNESK